MTTDAKRLLLYSHDSFGLGHLRRCISVAAAIVEQDSAASVMIVSGSPTPEVFKLPVRCEIVKLPSITKDSAGNYVPRRLPTSIEDLTRQRTEIIASTVRAFRPDAILVDHTAQGPEGELLPVLELVRRELPATQVLLGQRDIVDQPERVQEQMQRDGTIGILRTYYDRILAYGDPAILDFSAAYGLPADLRDKLRYVGIVCPDFAPIYSVQRREDRAPKLLATTGGGEDGAELLRNLLRTLRGPLKGLVLSAQVVTGPLMRRDDVEELRELADGDDRIELMRHTKKMRRLMLDSDLVVSMGGYNTVYEALRCGRRLLAVPRTHPRLEQYERCKRLANLGLLQFLSDRETADASRFARTIHELLFTRDGPDSDRLVEVVSRPVIPFRFDGAKQAASHILGLLSQRRNVRTVRKSGSEPGRSAGSL